jgi:transcriptional regulator with XRE-family HTH domain
LNSDKIFGKKLKELRKNAGLTQTQLAEVLYQKTGKHLTVASISYYETGTNLPALSMLPALAEILGVSIDGLFGREHPLLQYPEVEYEVHPLQRDLERIERNYKMAVNEQERTSFNLVAEPVEVNPEDHKILLSIAKRQQEEIKFLRAKFNLVRDMMKELKSI